MMQTLVRRLRRVEESLAPRPTEQDRHMLEIARRLESSGLPVRELPPLLPTDCNGPLIIAEVLRAKQEQRRRLAVITGGR